MTRSADPHWTAVAALLRPQGRKGELLAEPFTDLPEVFADDRTVTLAAPGATPPPNAATRTITSHWRPTGKNAGRLVLHLSGCDSINDAETLAGLHVLIPAQQLPTLAPDTFFIGDLIGCSLFNDGTLAGTVTDVEFATSPDGRTRLPDAAPLLAVTLPTAATTNPTTHPPDSLSSDSTASLSAGSPSSPNATADPVLIPFVRAWLLAVDIPARRITMHLPPGLLDPNTDPDPNTTSANLPADPTPS